MNMKQILNDPELSKELDKAYAIAAPYRERVQFRLAIYNQQPTAYCGATVLYNLIFDDELRIN